MKKLIVSALAVVVLAGLGTSVHAQQSSPAPKLSHKVGLIDMAYVFKEYKKFEALREDLKTEIESSDRKAKAMATQAQSLQEKLKQGTFKPGSPEYKKIESDLIQLKSQFEAFRTQAQRDFLQRESEIYKTVYMEVADAVRKYASYYKYTLVLRFNSQSLDEAEDPQKVLQAMNKQVVFYRGEDDITKSVLSYLNSQYKPQTASGPTGTSRK